MKRPSFNEKTEIKIISHDFTEYIHKDGVQTEYDMYGWRGRVTKIVGLKDNRDKINTGKRYEVIEAPYTPENYPDVWWVDIKIKSPVNGREFEMTCVDWPVQIEPVQKKFVDIDYIREEDLVIGKKADGSDAIHPKNTGAFKVGDRIQISTKIDGANASIAWDKTTEKLEIFSRTNLLNSIDGLRGFVSYIKTNIEPKVDLSKHPDWVIYGEWEVPHTCKYNKDVYNKWYVYDIWDKTVGHYLPQCDVKHFCLDNGLDYIEELYFGPFVSWEHCRSFIGKSKAYGPEQEGIVVKNQDALVRAVLGQDVDGPIYIKIVDEKFKEHMNSKGHRVRQPEDPEVTAAKQKAEELMASIVTEARVKKMVLKLVDEGILPVELSPRDMGTAMKHLPRRIFDDILKEESAIVEAAGEYAGKICSMLVSKLAKKIIIGS